jgi:type IV pilus assembly protein PilZ
VVWLAPSQGQRQTEPGIGLQFTGEHRHKVKQFIEDVLGDLVKQTPAQTAY